VLVWLCAVPGGFALLFLWTYGLVLLGVEPNQQEIVALFQRSFVGGDLATAALLVGVAVGVAPVVEELLFRAVIFRWLATRIGILPGAVVSGVFFGLVHGKLLAIVPVGILGILLALLLHRTGNLWSCVALHACFNAGQVALMVVFLQPGAL